MKVLHQAPIALANGEKSVPMAELDLELTNFSAGVRQQAPAGQRNGSTDIDELAHGAAIAEWLNTQALRGGIGQLAIAADPKTLGQIRQRCHKELESRIVGELAKDLINSPVETIERALVAA